MEQNHIALSLDKFASEAQGFTARSPGDNTTANPENVKPEGPQNRGRGRPRKEKVAPVKTPYVPVLDEALARELVISRMVEGEESLTGDIRSLRQFAKQMHSLGIVSRVLSVATLHRLFSGQMYPRLTDRDGVQFNWALIPRGRRGRRPGVRGQTSRLAALEQHVKRLTSVMTYVCHRLNLPHDLTKDPAFTE
jgi:hypothetical protein